MKKVIATVLLLASWSLAWAGAQIEEPLAAEVRTALSAAIANDAPPKPVFKNSEDKIAYLHWLSDMSTKLARNRWMKNDFERRELLETIYYEATRAALDPMLVLGLIEVESNFRKYAISSAGARGLMQVMPFWTRTIGNGKATHLFQLQANLRYGCTILRHYLNLEKGNLYMGLGRYNGSRGKSQYPNAVLAATKKWQSPLPNTANAARQATPSNEPPKN